MGLLLTVGAGGGVRTRGAGVYGATLSTFDQKIR
jgi:hypothetical protein